MPPVVATAAITAALSFAAVEIGIIVTTLTALEFAALAFAANLVLGFVSQALAPKPKTPNLDSFQSFSRDLKRMFRQPITYWRIVYGEQRLSGPLTFMEVTNDDTLIHLVITVAGHPVSRFGDVRLGDDVIHQDQLDETGLVTAGKYADHVRLIFDRGSTGVSFASSLASACPSWTSAHRQSNRAKVYVRLKHNRDKFPNGVPNFSVWTWGKELVDPRAASAAVWTNCSPLFPRDYLLASTLDGGMGASTVEVDDTFFTAAANVADEIVSTARSSVAVHKVSSVNASTSKITFAASTMFLQTGDRVQVSAVTSVAGGLSRTASYFVIVDQHSDPPRIQLASTLAKARSRTAVAITGAGNGSAVVIKTGEPRYAGGGVVSLDRKPRDVIDDMLTSFGGRLTNAGTKWKVRAASWPGTPSSAMTFGVSDLIGGIKVATRVGWRERFNSVKGVFSSPGNEDQPTDYPPYISSTYVAADGGKKRFKDLDLPYTPRPHTATRLAKIDTERARREITVQLMTNLKGLRAEAGSIIALNNARFGWSAKTFEVATWRLAVAGDNPPLLGCEMTLREIDSAVFDWSPGEEVVVAPAPRTRLPNPFSVTAPTLSPLVSGTSALFRKQDGTVVSRIKVAWTDSPTAFVDHYEVQHKKSAAADWEPAAHVEPGVGVLYIWDVEDGSAYDVRVRAVTRLGVRSSWATETNHTVVGKTALPSDVTGFSAQQNGNVVTFRWNQVSDSDLAGYEIRYRKAPFEWDSATVLTAVTRGTLVTNAGLPPGTWVCGVKARDNSGNYSATAAEFAINVSNSNDVIDTFRNGPLWLGTLDGFVFHAVSGRLVPESSALASNVDPFSTMTPRPRASAVYVGPIRDLGFDNIGIRAWAAINARLGPNETGTSDPEFQIDYRFASGTFDGFEGWTIGTIDARYVKGKVLVRAASTGAAYVSAFNMTLDSAERTFATTVAAAPGGTLVTFSPIFHFVKAAQVTADGVGKIAYRTSVTVSSMRVYAYNSAGADVGGNVAVNVVGV